MATPHLSKKKKKEKKKKKYMWKTKNEWLNMIMHHAENLNVLVG